jgi:hypothetical protein
VGQAVRLSFSDPLPIDFDEPNVVASYKRREKEGKTDAGLLCEVPRQERDENPQEHHDEEWQAGYSGCLSRMWHQDVQDRKELAKPALQERLDLRRLREIQPFL